MNLFEEKLLEEEKLAVEELNNVYGAGPVEENRTDVDYDDAEVDNP
ncbi:hypothetical protein [Labilibaculum manganireducens]|nr:hypothetical protein [Labilibaculum manganireducens]